MTYSAITSQKTIVQVTKPVRFVAIAQLCIAFTVLLWHLSQPFVGDLFRAKAQLLVFEEVMGIPPISPSEEKREQAERNRRRYDALPETDRLLISRGYERAQEQKALPFLSKLKAAFAGLGTELSNFELAWIILSIAVPILVLKQMEGARLAVWLVPLVSLFYVIENQFYGVKPNPTEHELLFPLEEILITRYMNGPMSDQILEQHAQLKEAWDRYLVDQWVAADSSLASLPHKLQVEKGGYAFNVARAKAIMRSGDSTPSAATRRDPFALSCMIMGWNVLFAAVMIPRFGKKNQSNISTLEKHISTNNAGAKFDF